MIRIDIYFKDLNESLLREILDLTGLKDPSEMNWDVVPLAIVDFEDDIAKEDE